MYFASVAYRGEEQVTPGKFIQVDAASRHGLKFSVGRRTKYQQTPQYVRMADRFSI